MKSRKHTILSGIFTISTLTMLCSCGNAEKAEGVQADITAAEMMGRTAARPIVSADPNDTVTIKTAFRKAAEQSEKYKKEGHPEYASKFDSTFYSTIRKIAPEVLYLDDSSRLIR